MQKAIIGKKIGMTQIFDETGRVVPVTLIQAGPCTVVQKKTAEKDGYNAIQLGYETVPERKLTKPELGHQKKAGIEEFQKVLKEFPLEDCSKYEVGDKLNADVFAAGDFVDVTGISKGHGYQGVIKRHGASRLKETHGTGPVHRHAGSMGSGTDPARIFKGKIGAGQMGNEQVTVLNLDVVKVDTELGLIAVRGAIPGPKGGVVFVKDTVKHNAEKKGAAGISKGHGDQGVIKRHGARRLKETHGTGPVHRHAGSMGSGTDPARIFKGRDGAGQMGNEQVTVQNLDIVQVDEELGLIAVRGAIPGPKGGVVFLRNSVKNVSEPKAVTESGRVNPQKASARVNPQKASARNKSGKERLSHA